RRESGYCARSESGQEETSCAPFKPGAAGVVLSTSCRRGPPKPRLFSGSAHAIGRHRILDQSPLFSCGVSRSARMRSRVWTLGREGGAGDGYRHTTSAARPGLPGVIIAATIGNVLEWFDFLVYGFFAVTIAEVFFPASNSTVSLLITFGT